MGDRRAGDAAADDDGVDGCGKSGRGEVVGDFRVGRVLPVAGGWVGVGEGHWDGDAFVHLERGSGCSDGFGVRRK